METPSHTVCRLIGYQRIGVNMNLSAMIQETALAAAELKKVTKLSQYIPYPWQKDYHNAGIEFVERMLMAANRVGKTLSAGAECAMHATGEYPDWWNGHRCSKPTLIWCGSVTNEASRDIVQKELLGGTGENLGTGFIPKASIVGKPQMRQAGVSDVVDKIKVRHSNGGVSEIVFKTYDQGWRKWQGTAPDIVWLDEEPDSSTANEKRIYSEAQTRVLTSQGRILVTFTPLLGETELVQHFNDGTPGTYLQTATWDDAPHLSDEDKTRLEAAYPVHEREARVNGVPMMGEGRVFVAPEASITIAPIEIPGHWFKIKGIDFGLDHPAGCVWLAVDRDQDIWYIYNTWRQRGANIATHAAAINSPDPTIPVAWPHDGMTRKDTGTNRMPKVLWNMYTDNHVNMLPMSARYEKDKGGAQAQEPIIQEFNEREQTGRLKVFSTCSAYLDERRSYHRKDGKVVSTRDDVLKSAFYAGMMQRYALQSRPMRRKSAPGRSAMRMP